MKRIKKFDEMLNENHFEDERMIELTRYYGYYNMANSLDIKKTAIPEFEKHNIQFEYNGQSNLLEVQVNEEQARLVYEILTNIAECNKSDGTYGEDKGDGAIVTPIKYY